MSNFSYQRFLSPFIFFLFVFSNSAFALSLNDIHVKSNFGERFKAEVEIITDDYEGIVVRIGSEQEYKDNGIKWGDVILDLYVKKPLIVRDDRRFILVVSDNSLFQPSFNLLLIAERTNGPVFENYLISVDFQDSVSLKGIRSNGSTKGTIGEVIKPKTSPEPEPNAPVKNLSDSGTLSSHDRDTSIVARAPTPYEAQKIDPPPAMKAFPKPLQNKPNEIDEAPLTKPKSPPRTRKKFVPFEEMISDSPASPTGSFDSKSYGPLKKGEDLEKITQSLNYGASEASRVAVALWMDNSDKFINGNIHGLKAGTTLEIGNIEQRLSSLTVAQADQIIQDHWREWKSDGEIPSIKEKEQPSPIEKALLEVKIERSLEEDLTGLIDEWKDSWIQEDLNRHMALFRKESLGSSNERGFNYWRRFKKNMFARHNNVQLDIQNPKFIQLKNKARVEFDQVFESDQMKSSGRKTIDLARSGQEWKIIREGFKVQEFFDKEKAVSEKTEKIIKSPSIRKKTLSPIVILVSTIPGFNEAIKLVEELRELGFGAYASPVYENKALKSYRVLVGRFSNMDLAKELARSLENFENVDKAIPVISPYVLEVGEFVDKENAEEMAKKLRSKGFPPFLFHTRDERSLRSITMVFVGTFEDRKSAMKMAQDLTGRGVISMVKEP
ncbi:MAG: SPOR domain-containing protein [Nitrospinales bacterium]